MASEQKLMNKINDGDLEEVKKILKTGYFYPYVLDGALLLSVGNGRLSIAKYLLDEGFVDRSFLDQLPYTQDEIQDLKKRLGVYIDREKGGLGLQHLASVSAQRKIREDIKKGKRPQQHMNYHYEEEIGKRFGMNYVEPRPDEIINLDMWEATYAKSIQLNNRIKKLLRCPLNPIERKNLLRLKEHYTPA